MAFWRSVIDDGRQVINESQVGNGPVGNPTPQGTFGNLKLAMDLWETQPSKERIDISVKVKPMKDKKKMAEY